MNTTKRTMCEKCPCLNRDFEAGEECNLGYHVKYAWFHKNGTALDENERKPHLVKDARTRCCSDECGLIEIRFVDGITHKSFKPQTL